MSRLSPLAPVHQAAGAAISSEGLLLGSLESDYAAVRKGPAKADGGRFWALELTGPDRVEFLHRLVSNSVQLEAGQGAHCYLLTVNGRPQLELWVFELGDRFWLVTHRSQGAHAFQDLDQFHFAEKLKILDHGQDRWALVRFGASGVARVEGGTVICPTPYFGLPAELWWVSPEEVPTHWEALPGAAVGEEALEVLRVEAGSPSPAEYTDKTMFLEVAGRDAYSETKGCYPGQEVVARTLHRGHINRSLQGLQSAQLLTAGARLLAGDKEAGWVARPVVSPRLGPIALAFVRREAWEPGGRLLTEDGREATMRELPFA